MSQAEDVKILLGKIQAALDAPAGDIPTRGKPSAEADSSRGSGSAPENGGVSGDPDLSGSAPAIPPVTVSPEFAARGAKVLEAEKAATNATIRAALAGITLDAASVQALAEVAGRKFSVVDGNVFIDDKALTLKSLRDAAPQIPLQLYPAQSIAGSGSQPSAEFRAKPSGGPEIHTEMSTSDYRKLGSTPRQRVEAQLRSRGRLKE